MNSHQSREVKTLLKTALQQPGYYLIVCADAKDAQAIAGRVRAAFQGGGAKYCETISADETYSALLVTLKNRSQLEVVEHQNVHGFFLTGKLITSYVLTFDEARMDRDRRVLLGFASKRRW